MLTAVERHLPFAIIELMEAPLLAAVVAAPILKECEEKRDVSQPRRAAAFFSTAWNWYRVRGDPLRWIKSCSLTRGRQDSYNCKAWIGHTVSVDRTA